MILEALEASYSAGLTIRSSPTTGIPYTETQRDFLKHLDSLAVRSDGSFQS